MPSIDLDDEFLELFYNITNSKPPKELELLDLKKQLINIVDTLKELNSNAKKPIYSRAINPDIPDDDSEKQGPAILIVDDLGVITYQLKVLLSQFDYDIDCSQEREGFILLAELKKMAASAGVNTIVGVITASPRKEIEAQCKARGADFFLEKNSDWQNALFGIMKSYIDAEKGGDDDEDDY